MHWRAMLLAVAAALLITPIGGSAAGARDPFARQTMTAMTFTHGRLAGSPACGLPCTDFIVADGSIGLMSAFSYLVAAKMLGERSVPVLLDSPGGNLLGAESLAQMFRKLGATVIVARARALPCGRAERVQCAPADAAAGMRVFAVADRAECESACPFAAMGGVTRIIPPGARIGLHAPSIDADSLIGGAILAIDPDARKTLAETDFEDLAGIARAMGVDEAIARRAVNTPHSRMDYLAASDVAAFRLSTGSLADPAVPDALRKALSPVPPGSAGKSARK